MKWKRLLFVLATYFPLFIAGCGMSQKDLDEQITMLESRLQKEISSLEAEKADRGEVDRIRRILEDEMLTVEDISRLRIHIED